jgi:hypothetical protein
MSWERAFERYAAKPWSLCRLLALLRAEDRTWTTTT